MRYQHKMSFGAEILDDAAIRFRLWAPSAQSLAVELSSKSLAMRALDEGWFELVTREAGPGTRYQFTIDGRHKVPDPASRYQPSGVHGPSEVIAPEDFEWQQNHWHGRPWDETILYELHVGTFSPDGTFAGAECRAGLPHGPGRHRNRTYAGVQFPGPAQLGL